MKALKFYILLFLAGVVLSCAKKKYPDSTVIENVPVYSFNATINNAPIAINAGINDYYMYSNYEQDSNKVYNFKGALKQINCTNCINSIQIQINDFKVSEINAGTNPDSVFRVQSYAFLAGTVAYKVQFHALFNKTASSYRWDFGDGLNSDDQNPTHIFSRTGNYNIRLTAGSADHCSSSIRQDEIIDPENDHCQTTISATPNTDANTLAFTQTTSGGKQPYTYLWSFGDGKTSAVQNPVHSYAVTGSYPVSLKITDADHNTIVANYNAITQSDNSSCAANYVITSVNRIVNPPTALALSKIIITWTDANGVVYNSNNELQPANNHFEITAVENGEVNENNQQTKKIHLKFNCMVYNGASALSIKDATAIINVAYN